MMYVRSFFKASTAFIAVFKNKKKSLSFEFTFRITYMVWENAEQDKWHQAQRDYLMDTPMQTRKLGMPPLNAL